MHHSASTGHFVGTIHCRTAASGRPVFFLSRMLNGFRWFLSNHPRNKWSYGSQSNSHICFCHKDARAFLPIPVWSTAQRTMHLWMLRALSPCCTSSETEMQWSVFIFILFSSLKPGHSESCSESQHCLLFLVTVAMDYKTLGHWVFENFTRYWLN